MRPPRPTGQGRVAGRQGKAGPRQGPCKRVGETRAGVRLPESPALNTGPGGAHRCCVEPQMER